MPGPLPSTGSINVVDRPRLNFARLMGWAEEGYPQSAPSDGEVAFERVRTGSAGFTPMAFAISPQ